jgi:hypothetical protein
MNTGSLNFVTTDRDRQRQNRRPVHTFTLRHRPFVIQPCLIAPVLPGETLSNVSMQSRVVSDPVNDKMSGCHLEYYLFYVKLRDLAGRDDFEEMLINPDKDMSTYYSTTADAQFNYDGDVTNDIPFYSLCYQRIVEEHFRGDDEAWNYATDSDTGLAVASVNNIPGWLSSLTAGDDYTAVDETISTAGDNAFTISELEYAMGQYQMAKMHGLTQKSFEDYLRDSGVNAAVAEEPHIPELIAMEREWTYPTNTVEPTDGSVASAWVWSHTMRRNQKKFFKEPGFIIGLTLVRPKTYMANVGGGIYGQLNTLDRWMPPELRNNPRMGSVGFAAANGPLSTGLDTEAYRVWMDDYFLYGDQFTNYAMDSNTNSVALPLDATDAINQRYPQATDINALFVDSTNTNGLRFIRQDGIFNFSIASYLRDSMPGMPVS